MYKIKQKFTIEYELNYELSKEDLEELGFCDNKSLKKHLNYNLQNIKSDIIEQCNTNEVNFTKLKSTLEINNGGIISLMTEEIT